MQASHETGLKVKLSGTVAHHLSGLTNIPISIVRDPDPEKKPFWRRSKNAKEEE